MLSLIDVIIIKQQDQTTDKTIVEAGEEVSRKLVQMVSRLHHVSLKKERNMEAIIGRYRARMEESGLVLKHTAGISFDLTVDETLELWDYINAYRQTLITIRRDTDPHMESIVLDEQSN